VNDLDPEQVVAAFDSTSVRHAATVQPSMASRFPNLGSSLLADLAVRAAGRWPGSVLRRIYTRIGASERISSRRLVDVDLAASQTRLPSAIRSDALRRYCSAAIVLKPDGMHFGPWIHDHGSRLRRTARRSAHHENRGDGLLAG
jgi:hypothetical protein